MGIQDWRIIVLASSLVLGACSGVSETAQVEAGSTPALTPEFVTEHSSRNALDWQGTYHGLLPCADCAGIYVVIDVGANTYQYRGQYLGKADTNAKASHTEFFSQGQIQWNEAGSHIELKNMDAGPAFYQVAEGALVQRDMQGKVIETEHPYLYRLPKRVAPNVQSERLIAMGRWQLIHMDGVAFADLPSLAEAPVYIAFNDDNIAYGFSGCNRFRGSYELESASRLSFSPLASTKMACPEPPEKQNIETQFNQVLADANYYILAGDQLLIFSHPSGRSARFVATPETNDE